MIRVEWKRWSWIGGSVVAVTVLLTGFVAWRASRALSLSRQELHSDGELAFTLRPFSPAQNTGFEIVRSPEVFEQLAYFQSYLYVAGPAGLSEYDLAGKLLRRFPAGEYLPGSPLVAISVGRLADAPQQELILATADQGVLAFDGQRFRQIYPADSSVRELTAILACPDGHLLLGTKKRGVLVYDGKTIQELHPTLDKLYVQALAGSDLDLWVGTLDQGVKHWHAGTTESFSVEQGLPDQQVQAIGLQDDKAYVGTAAGVAEFDRGRFSRVLAKDVLVTALYVRGEHLWVGSEDQGVLQLTLTGRPDRPALQRSDEGELGEVRQIQGTEDGVIVLTRGRVFSMKANGLRRRETLKPESAVLSDRNVSALALDQSGQLWVGYFDRGLDILPDGGLQTVHVEDEHVFCINRILSEKSSHTVEVATANGLVRFGESGKPQQVLGTADGLIAQHVTDVVPYRGGLAIATPAGVTFIDSEGARSIYSFHGLANNHVYALGVSNDDLMVGTLGGLSEVKSGLVKTNYRAGDSGLKQNWITAVVRVGDEWMVGTYGSGVMELDGAGRFHAYQTATAAVEINPNAMLVTPDHVFAGTLGQGLYIYDRLKQRWTIARDGLPSTNVTALAQSGGYIYVGTDNGLARIEESRIRQ
jgi:ligand-binding sensor domain-containing protein